MKEIKSLTAIRGIAAVYVMIFHFYYIPLDYSMSVSYFVRHIINHGHLAVDLFFFLSAFVMCLAYQNVFKHFISFNDYKTFMIKRFARIYPLYFVFSFIYFFIFDKSIFDLGINLTLFQIFFDQPHYLVDVFWSLSTEWIMYFIFPFLFILMNKIKQPIIHLILLLTLPLFLYLLKFVDYRVITSEGITNLGFTTHGMARGFVAITRCFLGYVIGISLFKFINAANINLLKKILKPLFIVPFVLLFLFKEPNYFFLIFFIFLIASCYINNDNYSFINTGVVYNLGLWSYSIYIIHRAVKFSLSHLINNPSLVNVFAIFLSIAVSYLTYICIEKFFNKKLLKALIK